MSRKTILLRKDDVRLTVVHHVYKEKTYYTKMPDGELIPEKRETLQKELTKHKWFKRDAICSVEEYFTNQNKVAKTRSIVYDKYSGRSYITFHSVEEVISKISQQPTPINEFNLQT